VRLGRGEIALKEIKLKHNSRAWLAFRQSGIGGSDASAIFGENPYKSNIELWKEKCGLAEPKPISCSEAVKYGQKAEKYLRALFALDYPQFELVCPKDTVYIHDNGFMFASLDGILIDRKTGEKGILEIKTSEIFASMHKEKWKDAIPQNYFIQVLHYLAVTGFSFAYLKAQLKSTDDDGEVRITTKHYPIRAADFQEEIQYLIEKETAFWQCVKNRKPPNLILPTI